MTSHDKNTNVYHTIAAYYQCCFSGVYQLSVAESATFGTVVGRVQATDRDTGRNAEMSFSIISGDSMDVFDISTDKNTQNGIITVKKVSD